MTDFDTDVLDDYSPDTYPPAEEDYRPEEPLLETLPVPFIDTTKLAVVKVAPTEQLGMFTVAVVDGAEPVLLVGAQPTGQAAVVTITMIKNNVTAANEAFGFLLPDPFMSRVLDSVYPYVPYGYCLGSNLRTSSNAGVNETIVLHTTKPIYAGVVTVTGAAALQTCLFSVAVETYAV